MPKQKKYIIGIVSIGGSGGGALLDLIDKKTKKSTIYPYELDFFREPNGLIDCNSRMDFIAFFIKRLKPNLRKFIETPLKMLDFNTHKYKKRRKTLILAFLDIVILVISMITFLVTLGCKDSKVIYLSVFLYVHSVGSEILVLRNIFFVEQLHSKEIDLLGSINIVIVRNIYDQLIQGGLYSAKWLFTPETIRESTILGRTNDTGVLSNEQLTTLLMTIKARINFLINFVTNNPEKLLVVGFEDLILNTDNTVERINNYCKLKGVSKNLITEKNVADIFYNSRKNIKVEQNLDTLSLNVKSLLSSIEQSTKFLVEIAK